MADESCNEKNSCGDCGKSNSCASERKDEHEQGLLRQRMASIKHKCMVMSGKGGVGKSTVATNLAVTLAMEGYRVGLMDADIHGPNIPKMMGIEDERPSAAVEGLVPISTPYGLKVMSIGFFLQSKDDAIIWRGPLKHNLIKQFLGDVHWGELDFLIVDLPPGTGDEALTIAQLAPNLSGAVIVTTPQDVATMDARKSVKFIQKLEVPVLGIIENMSGMICPHSKEPIDLFGKGGGKKIADELAVPFLGSIPIDIDMRIAGDEGRPFIIRRGNSPTWEAVDKVMEALIKVVEG